MASSSVQQLTQSSSYDKQFIAKLLAFEALSPNFRRNSYEVRVYSTFGTSYEEVLFPRRNARLVVSRPRKPARLLKTAPTQKIQWPDAHNAKEVAAFCAKQLAIRSNVVHVSQASEVAFEGAKIGSFIGKPALEDAVMPRASVTSTTTSMQVPRRVLPTRFGRRVNEA